MTEKEDPWVFTINYLPLPNKLIFNLFQLGLYSSERWVDLLYAWQDFLTPLSPPLTPFFQSDSKYFTTIEPFKTTDFLKQKSWIYRLVTSRCWFWTSLFNIHIILTTLFFPCVFFSLLPQSVVATLFFLLSFLKLAIFHQIPSFPPSFHSCFSCHSTNSTLNSSCLSVDSLFLYFFSYRYTSLGQLI